MNDYDELVKNNVDFFLKVSKLKPYSMKTLTSFFDMKNNKIIEMDSPYEHMEYLMKKYSWVKKRIDDMERHISDEEDDFVADLEPDEHPGWHTMDMYASDIRSSTYEEIFQDLAARDRLYRVGFYRKSMDVGPVYEKSVLAKDNKIFNQIVKDFELTKLHFS